jgi:hypothetical protein
MPASIVRTYCRGGSPSGPKRWNCVAGSGCCRRSPSSPLSCRRATVGRRASPAARAWTATRESLRSGDGAAWAVSPRPLPTRGTPPRHPRARVPRRLRCSRAVAGRRQERSRSGLTRPHTVVQHDGLRQCAGMSPGAVVTARLSAHRRATKMYSRLSSSSGSPANPPYRASRRRPATSRSPSHSFLVAHQSEPVPPSSKVMSTRLSLTL